LPQPGKLTADGQHWVYRSEGHRKCWFQTAESVVGAVKKPMHRHAVKQRVTVRESREAEFHKRKADEDAHAEVLRSASPEISTPSAPELKVADTASVPAVGASALAPVAESAVDQLTPDRPKPRLTDVETLRVSPSASDTIDFSVLPAIPVAFPLVEAGDDGRGWMATWLGVLLMALGLVSILSSSLPRLVVLFSRSE
jgi:hypothetical protein